MDLALVDESILDDPNIMMTFAREWSDDDGSRTKEFWPVSR